MPTDVTDLVRPITTPSLSLRIAVITMFLLKVPLIPFTDSVFRALGLHSIPWLLDSAEVLLSAFCSIGITQGELAKRSGRILDLYLKGTVLNYSGFATALRASN